MADVLKDVYIANHVEDLNVDIYYWILSYTNVYSFDPLRINDKKDNIRNTRKYIGIC